MKIINDCGHHLPCARGDHVLLLTLFPHYFVYLLPLVSVDDRGLLFPYYHRDHDRVHDPLPYDHDQHVNPF